MLRKNLINLLLILAFGILAKAQPLDFYIQKGLQNSPLLKEFNNQVLSGRIDSLLVLAGNDFQINQVSQAMYAPVAKKFGYDEAITDGGNYSAVISLEKSLFNQKTLNNQFKTIALLKQSVEADRKITIVELKKGITEQYLLAYADFLEIQFNQKTLDLLKNEQEILKSLANQGIYPQTDLMNLSLSVTTEEIAIRQSEIQYKNNLAVLNFICGINSSQAVVLEKPQFTIQNSFDVLSTPTMEKFRIDSLQNLNSRQLIDLNYRPKFSAFADAGFMAIRPENIPHNFGTSLGLNFSVPIYDGKQRKLQYDKTMLAEQSRQDYQTFYTSQYRQQILQLTEQLKLSDELITQIRKQLLQQENLIALYKIEIEKGLVRFLDFLSVVNSYTETQNTLTVSEMNRLQIINQLNYLK